MREGQPLPLQEQALRLAMGDAKVVLHVRLAGREAGAPVGSAVGLARAWGCDMSADYVRINADYTS